MAGTRTLEVEAHRHSTTACTAVNNLPGDRISPIASHLSAGGNDEIAILPLYYNDLLLILPTIISLFDACCIVVQPTSSLAHYQTGHISRCTIPSHHIQHDARVNSVTDNLYNMLSSLAVPVHLDSGCRGSKRSCRSKLDSTTDEQPVAATSTRQAGLGLAR